MKKVWVLVLSQLTVSKRINNLLRFCLHILLHFCWYNSLATYVYTALRTVRSFLWVCFGLFGCIPVVFLFEKRKQRTEKQTGCVAIANSKSKRQSKTDNHTEMKYVFWRVGIYTISFVQMKTNQLFRLRNLLLLVFVSCMNTWLWEIS